MDIRDLMLRVSRGQATIWGGKNRLDLQEDMQALPFLLIYANGFLIYLCLFSVDLRFPAHVTNGARDIISKLLKYQPEERLDLKSIVHHEWVQQHLTSDVKSKYVISLPINLK